jgi:NADPH:quinone reductase-like Zn-dependent oxidoreductase
VFTGFLEISDLESDFPHMKYKRIIVNRKRQLEVVEDDLPKPRPGEVRVKVLAAGVSFADVSMREGVHPEARRPPFTPGWDVVGTVEALGEGVEAVPVGTTVAAMPIVGGRRHAHRQSPPCPSSAGTRNRPVPAPVRAWR